MDQFDRASEQETMMRDHDIEAARAHVETLPAIGRCYNCESNVPAGVRFCDSECRDDYQVRRNAEVRRGRSVQ